MRVRALASAVLLLSVAACRGARIQPSEPRCDNPCPPVAFRPPPPQAPCGPCATTPQGGGIAASVDWDERISPIVDCNPVKTQHTLVVTVRDACGRPLPGQRVEWILARHAAAVGDIVGVDDQYGVGAIAPIGPQYAAGNNGNKVDNQFAVSVTNFEDELIDAANNYPYVDAYGQRMPDFRVGPGQSWITVTSVVEGVTDVIAYVPGIKDGAKHKIFAKKIWADYEVVYPPDAVNLLPAASHAFTVLVRKASDASGLSGTTIEAEVLDGPDATFDGGGKVASSVSGGDGGVTFTLRNAAGVAGTNRVRLTARGRFQGAECPRSQIVKKTWQKVALECRCAVSSSQADVGDPVDVTYTVTNTGDAPAENVALAVAPPPGLQVADGTVFPLNVGTIPGGGMAQKTVRFTAVGEGTQGLSFSASTASGGATTACGCSVDIVRGRMEIACRCEPGTVDVGHPIQIVGTISNTGRGTLRNVTLALTWPDGLTPQTQNVVTIAEIPPGRPAPEQFVFQGLPTRPGKFPAVIRATADGIAEVTSGCECAAVQCNLQISLICPGRIGFGEPGNFTVKVTNAGDGAANGCSVRVVHGPCLDGGTQDFALGNIAPGQTVAHDWTSAGTANAKCTVTAESNCQGCTARTECEVEVTGLPAIQTEMIDQDSNHVEKGIFRVGEEFLYVLEVQNDVATEATPPLRVQLDLPPEIQFISGTSTRGVTITGSGNSATSSEFRLDINEKLVMEFRVKASAVPPGNLVKASARILRASDGADLAQEIESTTVK